MKPSPFRRPLIVLAALLALAACAPAVIPPTATQPPTSTASAQPPTAATASSTAAISNIPVPATSVTLSGLNSVAFDNDDNLYVSQCGHPNVVRIDPAGKLTVYAGLYGGSIGVANPQDDGGPALTAAFGCAGGLAFDRAGNLFIADPYNNQIRRVDRAGIITTIAGADPAGGFAGDGGPATAAELSGPGGLAVGPDGNLYVVDGGNNRIRRIDAQGIITTVAGTGEQGFSGDGGTAAQAEFNGPNVIVFDAQNNLYIADGGNSRVRKVDPHGIVTTFAGTGQTGFAGDGGIL